MTRPPTTLSTQPSPPHEHSPSGSSSDSSHHHHKGNSRHPPTPQAPHSPAESSLAAAFASHSDLLAPSLDSLQRLFLFSGVSPGLHPSKSTLATLWTIRVFFVFVWFTYIAAYALLEERAFAGLHSLADRLCFGVIQVVIAILLPLVYLLSAHVYAKGERLDSRVREDGSSLAHTPVAFGPDDARKASSTPETHSHAMSLQSICFPERSWLFATKPSNIECLMLKFVHSIPDDWNRVNTLLKRTLVILGVVYGVDAVEFTVFQIAFFSSEYNKDVAAATVLLSDSIVVVAGFAASVSGAFIPIVFSIWIVVMMYVTVASLLLLQRLLSHLERKVAKIKTAEDVRRVTEERILLCDFVRATSKALQHFLGPLLVCVIAAIATLLSLSFSLGSEIGSTDTPDAESLAPYYLFVIFLHECSRSVLFLLLPCLWLYYLASAITRKLDLFQDVVAAHMGTPERMTLLLPLRQVSEARAAFTIYGVEITTSLFHNMVAFLGSIVTLLIRNLLKL